MGHFITFNLPYGKYPRTIDAMEQAKAIVAEARKLLTSGCKGVAITYSANYGQTKTIYDVYGKGGWNTQTGGANQAEVMSEMEKLLGGVASDLQGKLHIAPITTLTYESDGYGKLTHLEVVTEDLKRIKNLLDKNWDVLGWMNQDSTTRYAVGGGVKKNLPTEIENLIQTTLTSFAKTYPIS